MRATMASAESDSDSAAAHNRISRQSTRPDLISTASHTAPQALCQEGMNDRRLAAEAFKGQSPASPRTGL